MYQTFIGNIFDIIENAETINNISVDNIHYDVNLNQIYLKNNDEQIILVEGTKSFMDNLDLFAKNISFHPAKFMYPTDTNDLDTVLLNSGRFDAIKPRLVENIESLIVSNMLEYYSQSGIPDISKPKTIPLEITLPVDNYDDYKSLVCFHTPITEKYYQYFVSGYTKILSDPEFIKGNPHKLVEEILISNGFQDYKTRRRKLKVLLIEYIYLLNYSDAPSIFRSKSSIVADFSVDKNIYPLTFALK